MLSHIAVTDGKLPHQHRRILGTAFLVGDVTVEPVAPAVREQVCTDTRIGYGESSDDAMLVLLHEAVGLSQKLVGIIRILSREELGYIPVLAQEAAAFAQHVFIQLTELTILQHTVLSLLIYIVQSGAFQDGTHLFHLLREVYGTAPFSGVPVRFFHETLRRLAAKYRNRFNF